MEITVLSIICLAQWMDRGRWKAFFFFFSFFLNRKANYIFHSCDTLNIFKNFASIESGQIVDAFLSKANLVKEWTRALQDLGVY